MSFPTATQARSQATDNTTVLDEIHVIESAVLIAVQNNQLSSTAIGGSTVMTSTDPAALPISQAYYNVWKGTTTDDAKNANMSSIIDYFSQLGYGIKRTTNSQTGTTFLWYVTW